MSAVKPSNKRKVLCIHPIHPDGMKILYGRADLEIIVPENPEPVTFAKYLSDAEAIVVRTSKITKEVIDAAPKLKVISRHGVGVDNIDIGSATTRGVVVATVGLANAPSVVEHTIMLIFALAKRLPDFDRAVRGGDYLRKMKLEAIDVAGKRILIIGLGRIGSRMAKAAQGLGLVCMGVDPALKPAEIRAIGCEPVADFRSALPRADFVTLHCPLQDDTRNMFGAKEIALMRPTSYLINCARGGIVDEKALLDALNSGRLKGAGFDVQVTEPPRADDPLLKCDRVILTPHSAATTAEGVQRMSTTVAQNVLDYFDGKLPESHIFNPEALQR
jgi:D-3-phosphoglycerate dehydrogenase / 2-oxoglutarate reductase